MVQENHIPQVSIKPEEDARLPIYEQHVLSQWKEFAPKTYKQAQKDNSLARRAKLIALQAVAVLQQYQTMGFNPDQGREAAESLISDSLGL